jgi:hypothetical protein
MTNSVNTVDREALRCRAKPIVLVVLIRGSKAKEERERRREPKALLYIRSKHVLRTSTEACTRAVTKRGGGVFQGNTYLIGMYIYIL